MIYLIWKSTTALLENIDFKIIVYAILGITPAVSNLYATTSPRKKIFLHLPIFYFFNKYNNNNNFITKKKKTGNYNLQNNNKAVTYT